MRVNLGTIDVDDESRRALRARYGRKGLATREEVRSFYRSCGDETMHDVVYDYDRNQRRGED